MAGRAYGEKLPLTAEKLPFTPTTLPRVFLIISDYLAKAYNKYKLSIFRCFFFSLSFFLQIDRYQSNEYMYGSKRMLSNKFQLSWREILWEKKSMRFFDKTKKTPSFRLHANQKFVNTTKNTLLSFPPSHLQLKPHFVYNVKQKQSGGIEPQKWIGMPGIMTDSVDLIWMIWV